MKNIRTILQSEELRLVTDAWLESGLLPLPVVLSVQYLFKTKLLIHELLVFAQKHKLLVQAVHFAL